MSQIEPLWISNRRIFIRESSSKIYSPYVFAIGQLVGEIPYSILCAFVYWVLMVWPMGFGQGAAGANGNGFFFLVVLFIELFGGMSMSVLRSSRVMLKYRSHLWPIYWFHIPEHSDCCALQPIPCVDSDNLLRGYHPLPDFEELLAIMALSTRPLHPRHKCHALHRIAVRVM